MLITDAHIYYIKQLKGTLHIIYVFSDFQIMNHVKFENCTFQRVNFTNVKASYVLFKYSDLSECFLVDTNLGRSNFFESSLQNITYAGMKHLIILLCFTQFQNKILKPDMSFLIFNF